MRTWLLRMRNRQVAPNKRCFVNPLQTLDGQYLAVSKNHIPWLACFIIYPVVRPGPHPKCQGSRGRYGSFTTRRPHELWVFPVPLLEIGFSLVVGFPAVWRSAELEWGIRKFASRLMQPTSLGLTYLWLARPLSPARSQLTEAIAGLEYAVSFTYIIFM